MSAAYTCPRCHGRVSNANARRMSSAQLEAIHRESCPGIWRNSSTRKKETSR